MPLKFSHRINRFIFIPAFLISILLPIFSNSQTWLWANGAGGGTGTDLVEEVSVSVDAGGNVFVTGYFESPTITFGSTTLINAGGYDIFIAKYDATGNVLWAKSVGGTGDDFGYSVSADAGGNVFVTGRFSGFTITFGSTTLTSSTGGINIFIVKYDANGNVLWAKSEDNGDGVGFSVSADAGGNVFVTGFFGSPTITFGSTTLTNTGVFNLFITKYDANGNVLWAKSAGGTDYDISYSISADAGGNVFVTGYFRSPAITFGSTILTNGGFVDVFIAKYDAAGNVLWAKSAGDIGDDEGSSVSADAGGNVFITGYFDSPSIAFGSTLLTNAGGYDIFIAKYDANGNVLWAKSAGEIDNDRGWSVSADAGGNVFVTGGFFSPTITFGSTTLTQPVGSVDPMFIVKYDDAGNVLCASALSSGGDDRSSVSTDPFGNAYIGGDFMSSPFVVGSDTLNLTRMEDFFVAKYTCGSNTLTAGILHTNVPCSGPCTGTATAYPGEGTPPYSYLWSNSQTTQTVTGLCGGTYTVTVTDAVGSITKPIVTIIQPPVLTAIVTSTSAICGSNSGSATVTAGGGTPGYTYSWSQPSGGQITQTASGLGTGTYTVTVTDANGCTISDTITIVAYPIPTASFTYQPQPATILDPFIQFTDGSVYNISSWLWSFGDPKNGSSSLQNPKYVYTDTGTYVIQLIVTDIHGCIDTIKQSIKISADYIFYAPNSFTPNNDGINDVFIPQTEIIIPSDYSLIIFDRWGNKILESKDYKKGWDGKIKNTNTIAQDDVYIWMVKLSDFDRQQHDYFGRVTLLK